MTVPQVHRYFLPEWGNGSLRRYVALQLGQRVRRIIEWTLELAPRGGRAEGFYGLPATVSIAERAGMTQTDRGVLIVEVRVAPGDSHYLRSVAPPPIISGRETLLSSLDA